MQHIPLVSVVVPTWQQAPYIEACIQGILMQETGFPVEILIGEDDSTDGTRAICQRLAAEHPQRIRLFLRSRKDVIHIHGEPTGRANLLALFREAKGRYIAWCDGDDRWTDPLKLAKQVALLEADPTCMGSYHRTRYIDGAGEDTGRLVHAELPERMGPEDLIAPRAPFHSSSFLFRNSPLLQRLPQWTARVASLDLALFLLCIGEGHYRRAAGVMSAYRKHGAQITARPGHGAAAHPFNRILLWARVDGHFRHRWRQRIQGVVRTHWERLVRQTDRSARFRYMLHLALRQPAWCLRNPAFLAWAVRRAMRA
jgi:glycosyltransferase involved in cell wall biosynthesis